MNNKLMICALLSVLLNAEDTLAACGVLEVAKGDIKIQRAGGAAPVAAAAGQKVCSGETVIAAKDSRAKLKMEDGNELNISPDSKIALENYQFNASENKKKVLLNVLQGKVRATTKQDNMYNDKARDGQANSFQVKTKSAVAGVRGTDFLTGFDPKTSKTEIVTFRGQVDVGQPAPGGGILNPVRVGAGQKTESIPGQAPAPPKAVPQRELESTNRETRAETASPASTGPASAQPNDAKDKKEERKDERKEERKDDKKPSAGPAPGAPAPAPADERKPAESGERAPAPGAAPGPAPGPNGAPRPPSPSMLDRNDGAGNTVPTSAPVCVGCAAPMPPPPRMAPTPPPTPPPAPQVPTCPPVCANTKSKINIQIKLPNQ